MSNAITSGKLFYAPLSRMSHLPLGPTASYKSPPWLICSSEGFFTTLIVLLAASLSTWESFRAGTVPILAASFPGFTCRKCYTFPHLNWIPVRATGCLLKMSHPLRRLRCSQLGLMLFLCWLQLGLIKSVWISLGVIPSLTFPVFLPEAFLDPLTKPSKGKRRADGRTS